MGRVRPDGTVKRLKFLTVVGARPQFIKAAPMGRALRAAGHEECLVHTGQHYDESMSRVFFSELGIVEPAENLEVGSGSHAEQTAKMLVGIEAVLAARKPDAVIVFGDTNSTLAGALVAAKLCVPIAHVEAGLRSFDRKMPEEINRVVTDHLSTLLWAPGETAVQNLAAEGITRGVEVVGDIMADALADSANEATRRTGAVLARFGVEAHRYLVATIHRADNTRPDRLQGILDGLARVEETVLFPVHPRTRAVLGAMGHSPPSHVRFIDPVGHLDMMALVRSARMVLTDSGGLQKEAYWLGVPCVTLRDETEWVETVAAGWNRLVGCDPGALVDAVRTFAPSLARPVLYGDGAAASRCVTSLERAFGASSTLGEIMKILVTGVAGFIGSNLTAGLLARGHEVVGVDNLSQGERLNMAGFDNHPAFRFHVLDIMDKAGLRSVADGVQVIVHLAAYKIPRYSDALDTLRINGHGSENVIEVAQAVGAKVVAASTSDVYGKNPDVPFSEGSNLVIGNPDVKRWAYAISKMFEEQLLMAYRERHGMKVVIMRFFGGYGPNQNLTWWGGPQSVFINAALDGTEVEVHGDGSQTRSFTYISDHVDGIIRCVEMDAANDQIFNLGNTKEITILDLAKLVYRLVRPNEAPKIVLKPYAAFGKYEDVMRRIPDITKARTLLGFDPKVDMEQGLKDTIVWQIARRRQLGIATPELSQ